MADLDYFKDVNDQFEHVAGDACALSLVTVEWVSVMWLYDTVGRYGGEEFVFVVPAAMNRSP